MKHLTAFTTFISLCISLIITHSALAQETLFYSNIKPAGFTSAPLYNNTTYHYEWADDMPFTGSHKVSSFKMGYRSPEPVRAFFRFYGVDQVNGLPDSLLTEIVRELPAGEFTPTISLDSNEQFWFSAEPNLFNQNLSGGWFSVRFESLLDSSNQAQFRLAGYTSRSGIYNVDTDTVVSILDPSGLIPASMYLQVNSIQSENVLIPKLQTLTLIPDTVTAGDSGRVFIKLDGQAPEEGVTVKLSSSEPNIVFIKPEVVISAGSDNIITSFNTRKRVPRRGKIVEISAETSDSQLTATLNIVR